MSPEFWIGLAAGVLLAAAIGAIVIANRRTPGDLWDWSEEAYQPRRDEPRAITRIHSNNIDWEIR